MIARHEKPAPDHLASIHHPIPSVNVEWNESHYCGKYRAKKTTTYFIQETKTLTKPNNE